MAQGGTSSPGTALCQGVELGVPCASLGTAWLHNATAWQLHYLQWRARTRGLDGMFSRRFGDGVLAPGTLNLTDWLKTSGYHRILELGAGDGTALLGASSLLEHSNREVCAVGLISMKYNLAALGEGNAKLAMSAAPHFPHLAVAAGNTSRAAFEEVARRGQISMPRSTPVLIDSDFTRGLELKSSSFDLITSQTALSKMDLTTGFDQLGEHTVRLLRRGGAALLSVDAKMRASKMYNLSDAHMEGPARPGQSLSALYDGVHKVGSISRNLSSEQHTRLRRLFMRSRTLPIELVVGHVPSALPARDTPSSGSACPHRLRNGSQLSSEHSEWLNQRTTDSCAMAFVYIAFPYTMLFVQRLAHSHAANTTKASHGHKDHWAHSGAHGGGHNPAANHTGDVRDDHDYCAQMALSSSLIQRLTDDIRLDFDTSFVKERFT